MVKKTIMIIHKKFPQLEEASRFRVFTVECKIGISELINISIK